MPDVCITVQTTEPGLLGRCISVEFGKATVTKAQISEDFSLRTSLNKKEENNEAVGAWTVL
jgi:hypothetical protein